MYINFVEQRLLRNYRMANLIDIETYTADDMDEEIHSSKCYTKSMDVTVDNIPLVGIFMICHCGKNIRNAYKIIKERDFVLLGEGLDLHLHGKYCSYEWIPSTEGRIFYRRCNCRYIKQSAYR